MRRGFCKCEGRQAQLYSYSLSSPSVQSDGSRNNNSDNNFVPTPSLPPSFTATHSWETLSFPTAPPLDFAPGGTRRPGLDAGSLRGQRGARPRPVRPTAQGAPAPAGPNSRREPAPTAQPARPGPAEAHRARAADRGRPAAPPLPRHSELGQSAVPAWRAQGEPKAPGGGKRRAEPT